MLFFSFNIYLQIDKLLQKLQLPSEARAVLAFALYTQVTVHYNYNGENEAPDWYEDQYNQAYMLTAYKNTTPHQ